jgi:hypothetical protein
MPRQRNYCAAPLLAGNPRLWFAELQAVMKNLLDEC